MIQQLPDVVDLCGDRGRVRAHLAPVEVPREADVLRWPVELIGKRRVVGVNRRQKNVNAAPPRFGDEDAQILPVRRCGLGVGLRPILLHVVVAELDQQVVSLFHLAQHFVEAQ